MIFTTTFVTQTAPSFYVLCFSLQSQTNFVNTPYDYLPYSKKYGYASPYTPNNAGLNTSLYKILAPWHSMSQLLRVEWDT